MWGLCRNSSMARDAAAQEATGKTLSELEMIAEQWQNTYNAAAAAYGQNANTAAQEGDGVRYQIKSVGDKKYVQADRQVIFGNNPESWSEQLENYINTKIRNGENVTLIAEDGDVLTLTKDTAGKISDPHTSDGRTMSESEFERKVSAGAHIDELAQISKRGKKNTEDYNAKHGDMASGGWNYRTAFFQDFDGKYYRVRISVAIGGDGNIVYNIGEMQERSFPQVNGSSGNSGAQQGKTSFPLSVTNLSDGVKGNLSQLKSTAPLRQMMAQMPQQMMIRMPRLTTVEQDAAEAAANENPPAQGAATLPTMRQFQHPLGVSATQEGTYSVPQIIGISSAAEKKLRAGKHISLDEALRGIKDEAQIESVVKNLALVAEQGKIAYDAAGNIYAVDAAQHIDKRESYNVGDRKLNAFQFDHPQLHEYYAEIAGMLQDEFSKTEQGGQIVKFPGGVGENDTYIRTKRVATDRIAKLLDDEGMTYDDIDKALSAIVEDRGQENFAAAKRVELMIDEMLSNGYTDVYGYHHEPNREYITAKNAIVGADGYEVKVVQLSDVFTDTDVPSTEPLTRQDVAREMAWRKRMANEPAVPQVMDTVQMPDLSEDADEAGMGSPPMG